VSVPLAVIEDIVDASGVAGAIEALLPDGARDRQLRARTLLTGMHLALADGRPAHLTRVHAALTSLPEADQKRLGVIAGWKDGPHQLTYRQVEHTARLITHALARQQPDGAPSPDLQRACDALLEASIPQPFKNASSSLAVDWTDVEAWSRPVPHDSAGSGADPEARWGHRNVNLKIQEGEMFFGYYLPAAVMVKDENSPAVPEPARRITVCTSARDPAAALAGVLTSMPAAGIKLGDILADSGFSHRVPGTWAIPLRAAGADLVQDLHPSDRGPHGTHHGAIVCNGSLSLPGHPQAAAAAHPAAARSKIRPRRRPRPANDRTGTLQARAARQRRRRRLPPPGLPRCHRKDPLPAAPGVDEARPQPARDPRPAKRSAGLLHPANHHRRPRRRGKDPPETQLPLRRVADLLPAAHRRRAAQRHHQGPRRQHHRPRLDPPHRPCPAHAVARLPDDRPQPAHPGRIPDPPERRRPPCR
jgi:hypothetical protein